MSDGRVPNIVVIGDTHIGCKLALAPDRFMLDEGNEIAASKWQQALRAWWREFWDEFVPKACRGEPFVLVHIGDAIDGNHHGASSVWTTNIHDQILGAVDVLKPEVSKAQAFYVVRGTGVHVGESGRDEEALAEKLGAVRNEFGRHSQQELTLDLGGRLINFMHHISATASPYARATALQRLLTNGYVEAGRRGGHQYSMYVRGHRHTHTMLSEEAAHGTVTVVSTPAWQGKTSYIYSRDGLQLVQPEIGGVVIRLADDELFVRKFVRRPDPPRPVVI